MGQRLVNTVCVSYMKFLFFSLLASVAREVFLTSSLPEPILSLVWDLSDWERDGKLSSDEFVVACHLVRQLKKGL